MTNKEFAEKNAGKYFWPNGKRVRVAGYFDQGDPWIIVTKIGGWRRLDSRDRLIIKTKAQGFWYISFRQLEDITL